jgi:hypothetical protein
VQEEVFIAMAAKSPCYSSRNAIIGSTRDARRAGRYAANMMTASRAGVTARLASSGESREGGAKQARNSGAQNQSHAHAPERQHQSLTQHHPQHFAPAGADRHPDSDLSGPGADGIAIKPYRPANARAILISPIDATAWMMIW